MNPKLIKFLRAATPASPFVTDIYELQQAALKRGFILNPQVFGEDVRAFIESETIHPNSTFYKTWEDVVSKDRLELFLDQIRHYASTYGTGYTGEPYIPEGLTEVPDFESYTYIDVISEQELFKRCLGMLQAGIALKSDTVQLLCEAVLEGVSKGIGTVDVDSIRNREALVVLCKALGRRPSDPVALFRYIVYAATGETLLIRSAEQIGKIKVAAEAFDFNSLTQEELEKLASIFYRFKPQMLAFRGAEGSLNRVVINRLRRMAPRFHKPLAKGFWETLLSARPPLSEVQDRLPSATSFKLVALLQTVRERLLTLDENKPLQMYVVRNGKVFVAKAPEVKDTEYLTALQDELRKALVDRLAPKACGVRFPEELLLCCPSSEKNFLGNLPFGSSYPMKGHNFFGIYWRNEWGTYDFDISFVDWTGSKVGWNADFNTGTTVYSGDLTTAEPEASEIIYCKDICPNGTILCNRYNGAPGSRFRFFFGQEDIVDLKAGYMVRPDSIAVSEELTSDSMEKMLGIVCGGRAYLMDLRTGESRVSGGAEPGQKERILARKALAFINLKELLLQAGFYESDMPDLDLTSLDKDTLITLFS